MLHLPKKILDQLTQHALADFPNEACGILLGTPFHITGALPAKNLAPPHLANTRYTLDPQSFLQADTLARAQHLQILGFYHSHPNSPATFSATDQALAYPTYIYLILSITPTDLVEAKAYHLINNLPTELPILNSEF